ncbi:MAG: ROK family protein [Clostridia bacterium]|nr:ROK family protein [Clostridia bacterium]
MYKIGIDLGGTNIAVGLVDDDYKLVLKKSRPTNAHRTPEEIAADMSALCIEVCEAAGISIKDIEKIGIASPGVVDPKTGVAVHADTLPFNRFPLADHIRRGTGVQNIALENDANCAALGEAVAGAAKGKSSGIMITLGTGVGGGVIIDGKVYAGFNHAGAELGHMVIEKGGVRCSCGREGCWEAYSSATALIRMTKEKIEECRASGRDTIMFKAEKVSGRTACDAMRQGDAPAREVYEKYISYLATGITNMLNIFQPEVLYLGGGVSNEGQSLIDDLSPLVYKEVYGGREIELPELKIAQLGNDAGIIGAAAL